MLEIQELDEEMLLTTIPDDILITTDASSVLVVLNVDDTDIFETTLYPYNGQAHFIGFVQLIKDYCEENDLTLVPFEINVVGNKEHTATQPKYIIYSRHFNDDHDATFLLRSFLTTKNAFILPRAYGYTLTWMTAPPDEETAAYMECVMMKDGKATTYRIDGDKIGASDDYLLHSVYVSPNTIQTNVITKYGEVGTLKSVTVHRGERYATFFITDKEPTAVFMFRNTFNRQEQAFLFAETTHKTDIDHSEAVCNGVTKYYDKTIDETFEVETSNLTYEEAEWLTQLLESHKIAVCKTGTVDGWGNILITNQTCEISDAINSTNRIKFTWKYEKEMRYLPTTHTGDIFTTPYNDTFN